MDLIFFLFPKVFILLFSSGIFFKNEEILKTVAIYPPHWKMGFLLLYTFILLNRPHLEPSHLILSALCHNQWEAEKATFTGVENILTVTQIKF